MDGGFVGRGFVVVMVWAVGMGGGCGVGGEFVVVVVWVVDLWWR